jgi:hypothetical protein
MSPQDGGRLRNTDQTEQVRPEPGHPYQQGSITIPQPQPETLRCPPQSDAKLMTKKEVLAFKPTPQL